MKKNIYSEKLLNRTVHYDRKKKNIDKTKHKTKKEKSKEEKREQCKKRQQSSVGHEDHDGVPIKKNFIKKKKLF